MKSFRVLDRNQNVHRSYLLEASAGTGKTFAIENIVVRLLAEDEPLALDQILVVTFTRAATRDLKLRIRSNIEKALEACQNPQLAPDYLLALFEKGGDAIALIKRRLEHALFCFDTAQIFTIHSFCSRMLRENLFESDVSSVPIADINPVDDAELICVIRDYFRTELRGFSAEQLRIALKNRRNSIEKLEQAILKILKRGLDIVGPTPFSTLFERFCSEMRYLASQGVVGDKIIVDTNSLSPNYKKISADGMNAITRFAQLFNKSEWNVDDFDVLLEDGLYLIEAFDPSQKLQKEKTSAILNYPFLQQRLKSHLQPIVDEARDPENIIAGMAYGCQKMVQEYLSDEEKMTFDDILKSMRRAIQNPQFVQKIRLQYRAAIVDEFQDTDPIQWDIFKTLFSKISGTFLYLVGDPKQSIYAFRQADIYTYLDAAKSLGNENRASLDTNYRSSASLVHALNKLFNSTVSPGLISLPQHRMNLEYQTVIPSGCVDENLLKDEKSSVHFFIAEVDSTAHRSFPLEFSEENFLFPFIASEIFKLHDSFSLKEFAILVSDRFQAKRIGEYLSAKNIPVILQRSGSLTESLALSALRDVLQAVLHSHRDSEVKVALGGRIIGFTHKELCEALSNSQMEESLFLFNALRNTLLSNGFASFFDSLMQSCWNGNDKTVEEKLLSQRGGFEFHQDLQQIAQIIVEKEFHTHVFGEKLLDILDDLMVEDDEAPMMQRQQDPNQDAVQILTIHSSKGLEFPIVFALGLVSRKNEPEGLLPIKQNSQFILKSVSHDDANYSTLCEEIDAEKMRQLYVALTRAKYRVYAPVIVLQNAKDISMSCASPMELFLARLGFPETSNASELYARIKDYDAEMLTKFVDNAAKSVSVSYSMLNEHSQYDMKGLMAPSTILEQPRDVFVPGTPRIIYSYSTLAKRKHGQEEHDIVENTGQHAPTLPLGSETGNLLHTILENISFDQVRIMENVQEMQTYIQPMLRETAYSKYENEIAEILFNALTVEYEIDFEKFRLCDIEDKHCFREKEFLYLSEEKNGSQEYLKGVIDLFFHHNGKYYVLDWKSNWLENFTPESMHQAMLTHDYYLQEKIYREAMKKYLRVVDGRPFEEIYGGSLYMFLRGQRMLVLK